MADITTRGSPKHKADRFFVAVTAMMAVVVKRASRLPLKLKAAAPSMTNEDRKVEVRSPKKLLINISSKTMPFIEKSMRKMKIRKKGEEQWGDGGVWQKAILMGDKCEPLDFSGVIYYDSNGKQVNELPLRSPRASPVPGYFVPHRHRKLP